MPLPSKPKPTLTVTTVEDARKAMFVGWLNECAEMQDAFIEAMLANLMETHEGE